MKVHILKNSDLMKAASDGRITAWGHGANCFGVMGAGISGIVMRMFPGVYKTDTNNPDPSSCRLGHFSYHTDRLTGVIGVNLYTQFQPGKDARLSAIHDSVSEFVNHLSGKVDLTKHYTFGVPALGCGIGGINLLDLITTLRGIDKPEASIDLLLFLRAGEYVNELNCLETAMAESNYSDVAFYESLDEYEEKKCTHLKY